MADAGDRHDEHDPLRIAALLDRDLDPAERASGEALVASCRTCAALEADLRALARATPALQVPARPRDFRLTAVDAARLSTPAGEPGVTDARLTGEMHDPATTAAHATHDTLLVASLADRSLTGTDRAAAEALVAACSLCAALRTDLVALSAATRAMPTPSRPREYTLTPADAIRLRPTGWRRWVAAFGTSRDSFSRPLAVGLTTLGLAGLLVTSVPTMFPSSASSGPIAAEDSTAGGSRGPTVVSGAAQDVASGAPSAPGALAPGPTAVATSNGFAAATGVPVAPPAAASAPAVPAASAGALGDRAGSVSSPPPPAFTGEDASKGAGGRTNDVEPNGTGGATPSQAAPAVSTTLLLSGALLLAGLGLFVGRWATRRSRR